MEKEEKTGLHNWKSGFIYLAVAGWSHPNLGTLCLVECIAVRGQIRKESSDLVTLAPWLYVYIGAVSYVLATDRTEDMSKQILFR